MFLGRHGAAKSSCARFISDALSKNGKLKLIRYACDKENMISMVGIPSPQALAEGKLEYVAHERSVFNADIVMLDEITRAQRDTQNMLLEILQEKTVFGKPLKYEFVIATANNETYQAAYKLDEALFDRFWIICPVPDLSNGSLGAEEIKKVIKLNMGKRLANLKSSNLTLSSHIEKIREGYKKLLANKSVRENTIEFTAKLYAIVLANIEKYLQDDKNSRNLSGSKPYISPRQFGEQTSRLILAVAAYYKYVENNSEYLQKAAWNVIEYSIGTKIGIPLKKLKTDFDSIKELLSDEVSDINKLKVDISTSDYANQIELIGKNTEVFKDREKFGIDEVLKIVGDILQEIHKASINSVASDDHIKNLVKLHNIFQDNSIDSTALAKIQLKVYSAASNQRLLDKVCSWDNCD
jgi:MoxR-like ATPase